MGGLLARSKQIDKLPNQDLKEAVKGKKLALLKSKTPKNKGFISAVQSQCRKTVNVYPKQLPHKLIQAGDMFDLSPIKLQEYPDEAVRIIPKSRIKMLNEFKV